MGSLREPVTFEQATVAAAGLRSDAETDSDAQYDRGMCELIADLWPKEGVFHADRRDEIAEMLTLIASIEEAR